jgi:uncharacterized Zn finger protein
VSKITFSRTWWGKRFLEVLKSLLDTHHLARGRSYAKNGKIQSYHLKDGRVIAIVKGSINPYLSVYQTPYHNYIY